MVYIILSIIGLVIFILLVTSDESRQKLLYLGLFTIVIGHRSIYLGNATYIVPLEILYIVLFIFVFGIHAVKKYNQVEIKLPFTLLFVFLWAIGYGIVSWLTGSDWDPILAWTLPLVIGLPAFWLIRRYIRTPEDLSITLKVLSYVATIMSILALIEYRYPSIAQVLPQIFSGKYILTADGFVRASFSFWGYPAGAVIVTWGMLIAYQFILEPKHSFLSRLVYIGILMVDAAAVYASGQRSSWIGVICGVLLLSLQGRFRGVTGVILIYTLAGILPAVFWHRFATVTDYLEKGTIADSSIGQRLSRWSWAWNTTTSNPLGGGYGHWLVHNTILEISSTIGIFAAIAFAIFIVQLVLRIARVALSGENPEAHPYAWLFLAISITWLIQLNIETPLQTPPLAVAFWPYMAIAWYIPNIFNENKTTKSRLQKRP